MSFEGYDFVNGITLEQAKKLKGMSVHALHDMIDRVIAEANGEMRDFLAAQQKWNTKGTRSALKEMRMILLRLGKLQRSFQIVRMEYMVAESERRGA